MLVRRFTTDGGKLGLFILITVLHNKGTSIVLSMYQQSLSTDQTALRNPEAGFTRRSVIRKQLVLFHPFWRVLRLPPP